MKTVTQLQKEGYRFQRNTDAGTLRISHADNRLFYYANNSSVESKDLVQIDAYIKANCPKGVEDLLTTMSAIDSQDNLHWLLLDFNAYKAVENLVSDVSECSKAVDAAEHALAEAEQRALILFYKANGDVDAAL